MPMTWRTVRWFVELEHASMTLLCAQCHRGFLTVYLFFYLPSFCRPGFLPVYLHPSLPACLPACLHRREVVLGGGMGGSTANAAGNNAGGPLFDVTVALGKRDEVTCCISCK